MLFSFFVTCNKIGAFTLGGGYAMIPIMEREFVDHHKWMDKQEFMDIMVVAQATPGIFAIDMASHIGYKLRGIWGGIVGAIGIALPSIIAIIIIAMFFRQFKNQTSSSSPHRCSLLQNGKNCQDKSLQCLDSCSQLRPHLSFRRLTHLHHHCGWCVGMAVWKDEKGKKVKR